MSVLEQLQTASWRGLEVLFSSEQETGGKKTATHEYPNSDRRFTEELGIMPPKFTVDFVIHGSDAINRRIRFRDELNRPGLGTLVHPVYGTVEVMSTTFSAKSTQSKIGEFLFSVNFEQSAPSVTPAPSVTDSFTVSASSDVAREALDDALGAEYKEPTLADSLNSAAAKITEISQSVSDQINRVRDPLQDGVAAFTRVTNTIEATVFTVVQQADTIKSTVGALYSSFLQIASTPADLIAAWQELTSFSLGGDTLPTNTAERQVIANNTNILNEHTRITALIGAYESVAYVEFTTEGQLLSFQEFLDEQYDSMMRDSITDVSISDTSVLALDRNVRSTMADLRTNTRKALDQLKENVWRVVDAERQKSSMPLLAYRYYGDIDNLDLLSALNPDANTSGFNKALRAVTK